jgi:hypothetical protein
MIDCGISLVTPGDPAAAQRLLRIAVLDLTEVTTQQGPKI